MVIVVVVIISGACRRWSRWSASVVIIVVVVIIVGVVDGGAGVVDVHVYHDVNHAHEIDGDVSEQDGDRKERKQTYLGKLKPKC